MRPIPFTLTIATALMLPGLAGAQVIDAPGEPVTIPGATVRKYSVKEVQGRFGLPPRATGKVPAVLILHGANGVDGRGAFHATALQEAGIATLEITMFASGAARGVGVTMPYAAAALAWLATRPEVDAGRIGVMGFSYGGVMTVLLSSELVQERLGKDVPKPVAFAPLYPVCSNMARSFTQSDYSFPNAHTRMSGSPMLIHAGTHDGYETGERPCDAFVATWPAAARERTTVRNLETATHAFDTQSGSRFLRHPRGGTVHVIANPTLAADARQAIVRFFVTHLKL
jgi:dienelactone hydrolase